MISTLRTYRSLRLVAVLTLFLSAGLPIVRYSCAQTGSFATALTSEHTANSSSCAAMPTGVHNRLCKGSASNACFEATVCTTDTEVQVSAVVAPLTRIEQEPHPAQAGFLAALAWTFTESALQTDAFLPSSRVSYTRQPSPLAGVPVRLRTTVFLL